MEKRKLVTKHFKLPFGQTLLSVKYNLIIILLFYMYGWFCWMYVCALTCMLGTCRGYRMVLDNLGQELQAVVRYYVGDWNWTKVLCRNNTCFFNTEPTLPAHFKYVLVQSKAITCNKYIISIIAYYRTEAIVPLVKCHKNITTRVLIPQTHVKSCMLCHALVNIILGM